MKKEEVAPLICTPLFPELTQPVISSVELERNWTLGIEDEDGRLTLPSETEPLEEEDLDIFERARAELGLEPDWDGVCDDRR